MGTSLEQLADRLAIEDVLTRYAWSIDTKNFDGLDEVFAPDAFTVEPGEVRLTVINVGEQMVHDFRFTPHTGPEPIAAQIDILPAGEEKTLEFEVTEPGDHPFECSFHVQLGQVGTMTVSG